MRNTWTHRDGMRFLYLVIAFTVLIVAIAVLSSANPALAAPLIVDVTDGDTTGSGDWVDVLLEPDFLSQDGQGDASALYTV